MLNLDGIWEFAETGSRGETPVYRSFFAVPGCFDVAGLAYPRKLCAWFRRSEFLEKGVYRMRIGSFGLRAAVFCDGVKLAESALAWSPLEAEFSVERGMREFVIRVDNFTGDHPLFRDFYDFYPFGGIFDHVTLESVLPDEICSLQILPLDHRTGEVEIRVETTADQLRIAFDHGSSETVAGQKVFRRRVPDFKLWSPEEPNLHLLTVNEKTAAFGIRTLDWSGPRLLLNGKALKLLGVNRHESHPEFGAATPESLIASDLLRIRKAGFNFIRGCHYPQRKFLFDLCDRIGLMVWEEPLAWGNNALEGRPADFTQGEFLDALAEQLALTIRNSINHPSLIIHGFLNECGSSRAWARPAVRRMAELCRAMDPTRPTAFASNRPDDDLCFDLVDLHAINIYPGWYRGGDVADVAPAIRNHLEKLSSRPVIISEIGASAIYGDHSGVRWSEEYQAALVCEVLRTVKEDARCSGAALWMFADANTYINNVDALARPRGFNNKGLLDEYRRPKLAWGRVSEILHEKQ